MSTIDSDTTLSAKCDLHDDSECIHNDRAFNEREIQMRHQRDDASAARALGLDMFDRARDELQRAARHGQAVDALSLEEKLRLSLDLLELAGNIMRRRPENDSDGR